MNLLTLAGYAQDTLRWLNNPAVTVALVAVVLVLAAAAAVTSWRRPAVEYAPTQPISLPWLDADTVTRDFPAVRQP